MASTLSLDSEQLLGLIFLPGSPTRTQIEKLWHNIKYERVQYIYLATIERCRFYYLTKITPLLTACRVYP